MMDNSDPLANLRDDGIVTEEDFAKSKRHGRLLIWILVLTIMAFMVLVIARCLVEYRKYLKSLRRGQPWIEGRYSNTTHEKFKEELQMAVRKRKERLEQAGEVKINDDNRGIGEERANTVIIISSFTATPASSRDRQLNLDRRISDVNPDAIEEAPLDFVSV